ncbi:MAG: glycosyltransferase family 4 protein [Rubrimonas sp.]|uniref:glycosyltransferase family 4 protein n=1 Tax=Rubrimonas sp. TaxID=2036015 RepID=UPI002FDD33A3
MSLPRALIATQCFPPRIGGVETLMAEFARALGRAGWAVEVLADGPGPDERWPDGATVTRRRGFKPLRRWLKARALRARLAAVAAERGAAGAAPAPLLVADSWKSLELLAPGAAERAGARVLCLAHGMEIPARPSARKARRMRSAFAKATAVVANSAFTAARVAPHVPYRRVEVVAPGVAAPPEPDEAARAALAALVGAGRPLIATLARLEPRKGVDMTLRAVAVLAARHPGLVYAIAGDGPDLERLRALAAALGVEARARFLGRVDDGLKAALLSEADLFCMPARREGDSVEGFGLAVLEAGWFGTPALGGAGGGMTDAIEDGETGLLCDGSDADAVADALGRLLDDAKLRRRLGAAARGRARACGWDATLPRYLACVGLG